ncbi:hypothetical protein [Evansella halocellulosilytica]|uniref:hypothetical protein n=1 Tax=Evansella halocellulosilytica TaxID=2011013 RepID=UPI000BB76722|nr:hypothetical protein [Evansella halocellulosilytica]
MSHFKSSIRTIIFALSLNIIIMILFAIRDILSLSALEMIAVAAIIHSMFIIPIAYFGCLIGEGLYKLLGALKDNTLVGLLTFGLLGFSLSLILYPFFNEDDNLIYFLFSFMFVCSTFKRVNIKSGKTDGHINKWPSFFLVLCPLYVNLPK